MAHDPAQTLNDMLASAEARWGRPLARFDPADGAADADLMLLRRDPRCRVREHPVVSLDSGHPADTNLRTGVDEAGLDRSRLAVWHLAPWYLEDPAGPPRAQAWAEAVELAEQLWPHLPRLRCVVLLGGDAQRAWPRFAHVLPGVRVLDAPHPSPLAWHRRAASGVRNRDVVVETLRAAARR